MGFSMQAAAHFQHFQRTSMYICHRQHGYIN